MVRREIEIDEDTNRLLTELVGGSWSLMARRLDRNHHPVDPPFPVFEFPGRIHPGNGTSDAMTAVPGRFLGAMTEFNSNIWMMDLPK